MSGMHRIKKILSSRYAKVMVVFYTIFALFLLWRAYLHGASSMSLLHALLPAVSFWIFSAWMSREGNTRQDKIARLRNEELEHELHRRPKPKKMI